MELFHAFFIALILCIVIMFLYATLLRGEGFTSRAEKQSSLFDWFTNGGAKKSYDQFRDKFRGKKADIVDFEKGRIAYNAGTMTPELFS